MSRLIGKNILFAVAIVLSGCGGGGSDDSKKPDVDFSIPIDRVDPNNVPPERQAEWNEYALAIEKYAYSNLNGLYDVSVTENGKTDLTYILIDAKSPSDPIKLFAYNYMNDQVSSMDHCYQIAKGSDINASLNLEASKVSWTAPWKSADGLGYFQMPIGNSGKSLKWSLDQNENITGLSIVGESLPIVDVLRINTDLINISVVTKKEILGNVSPEGIKANICEGVIIADSPSLGSNFVGLYDVSLTDSNGYKYETYINFDADGKVEAIKYMGDGYDSNSNQNCYALSPLFNKSLHGKVLLHDVSRNQLFVKVGADRYSWNLDDTGKIVSVSAGDIDTSSIFVDQSKFISISSKVASISLADINSMRCLP